MMTARTAVEIFTQADDLQIAIIKKAGKFGILISRGPNHRFKPLVSTKPAFESRDKARRAIVERLESFCRKSRKVLKDRSSPLAQLINPNDIPISEMQNILTTKRLDDIKHQLKRRNTVNTYKLFAA